MRRGRCCTSSRALNASGAYHSRAPGWECRTVARMLSGRFCVVTPDDIRATADDRSHVFSVGTQSQAAPCLWLRIGNPVLLALAFTECQNSASFFVTDTWLRPLGRLTFLCLCKEKVSKRNTPRHPGLRFAQTPLAPVLLRGSSRRAIHGPSFLIWHPCQMPLCTTPALGLLTRTVQLPNRLRRVENAACGFSTERDLVDNAERLSTLLSSMHGLTVPSEG
mgnify:CR=1 FL=1